MSTRDRRAHKRTVVYRAVLPEGAEAYEAEYESVADALHFACRDLRTERRRPLEILEDGVVVYDAAQIAAECVRHPDRDALQRLSRSPD